MDTLINYNNFLLINDAHFLVIKQDKACSILSKTKVVGDKIYSHIEMLSIKGLIWDNFFMISKIKW